MKSGKVTAKHQVTVPPDVRKALGIKPGDAVSFAVEDGYAVLRKIDAAELAWLKLLDSTLEEWNSPENDKAWAYLSQ